MEYFNSWRGPRGIAPDRRLASRVGAVRFQKSFDRRSKSVTDLSKFCVHDLVVEVL